MQLLKFLVGTTGFALLLLSAFLAMLLSYAHPDDTRMRLWLSYPWQCLGLFVLAAVGATLLKIVGWNADRN